MDEKTSETIIFNPKPWVADKRNRSAYPKKVRKRKRLLDKKVRAVLDIALKKKTLHGCTKSFLNFRKKYLTDNHTTEQADNPPLRYVSVMSHTCIAFVLLVSFKRQGWHHCVVGCFGVHFPCSEQVKTGMKGMLDEWSTQRARRVRVCAVLAMHVPNVGIHTLWRLPCASNHPPLFFTGQREKCLLALASP